ncbi:MAG: molybdopterin molybdotransferase MoeA [Eudoraea sp.]|nr:molybdopterin molybdotransferase MoeA [Eudoraea sp.]NNL01502.1 molybdopterin molybdotransferase MoeA [Eudoraea sp.]
MEKTFITYEEALSIIELNKNNFVTIQVPIKECGGYVLAEDLTADRDLPPYDRITMDGIAIDYDTFRNGQREFPIKGVAPAGSPQQTLDDKTSCIEVMTGAILPNNTDTVIRYEDLTIADGNAHINIAEIEYRQNIHFKGSDIVKDSVITKAGNLISSAEINVAAATGKFTIAVKKMPKAVIISTGDELVDVHETPLTHQIRRSNVYGIQNTLIEWGIPAELRHLPDDKEKMQTILAQLLQEFDLLIITGGVSKGKFDYLPDVLTSLGVVKHFHKIQQRPGKPFWFGTSKNNKRVFALPGNPVSSFVCVYIYLRFWLIKSLGIEETLFYVALNEEVHFKPNLIYFLEAKLESKTDGYLIANPVKGNGSGDFANLVKADGFLILPQNKTIFMKGEVYPFVPYRSYL